MDSSAAFQLADSQWLWIIVVIPVVVLAYYLFYRAGMALDRLKSFADQHLLPHLVRNRKDVEKRTSAPLIFWSIVWVCGALAMAGPRWDFRDVEAVKPERALVILLDLSASMDAQDVKPSRVARARQKIDDILTIGEGLNVGLIAFASIPHMVAPLTDDMGTIRNFLPHLDTSLVYMQGSRLEPAMEMALQMLKAVPGKDKSILVISDGGFVDDPVRAAREAYRNNIEVYAMGVGTAEGAPIPAADGNWLRDGAGTMVVAKMDAANLQAVASAGGGFFATADYTDSSVRALLHKIGAGPDNSMKTGKTVRIWDEKFYIPALLMVVLLLPWFRRGYVFPLILLGLMMPAPSRAATISDMFMNPAQQGRAAFDQGNYNAAVQKFDTPYRKGVAEYKAGAYDKAIGHFNDDSDPRTRIDSEYNRGNAQLKSGLLDDAIASYNDVLKQRPGDKNTQRNLEIAKKIKEQKEEQKKQQDQQQKQQDQQQQQSQSQQQKQPDQQQQQSQNQQQKQQDQQQQQSQNQQQKQPDQQQQQSQNQQQKQQDQQQQQSQNQQQKQQDQQQQQQSQSQQQKQQDQQQQQSQQAQNQQAQNQQQEQHNQQQSDQQHKEKGNDSAGEQKSDKAQKQEGDKQAAGKDGNQSQGQQQQGKSDQQQADAQQGKNTGEQKKEEQAAGQKEDNSKKDKDEQQQASGQREEKDSEQGKEKQASGQQDKNAGEQKKEQQTAGQQEKDGQEHKKDEQHQDSAQQDKKEEAQGKEQKAADQQDKNGQGHEKEQAAQKPEGNQHEQEQAAGQKQDDSLAKQMQQSSTGDHGGDPQESASMSGNARANSGSHRTPGDVDADQWLSRAESDPGPLLKNQFMIESRKSAAPQGDDPW